MPKVVDHEQRRRQLAEAVRRIAADRGLEAVSLGEVAAEAGVSKGLVQHYFAGKDEMLRYAATTLRDDVDASLPAGDPTLRETVLALLPVDEDARAEALVANAFLQRALRDADIAARFRAGHGELLGLLVALVEQAQAAGELAEDLAADDEAELLVALVGGLGDAILLGYRTPDDAVRLVDLQLSRLASGSRPTR